MNKICFICHTPHHINLAMVLVEQTAQNADIILYEDFKIEKDTKKRLNIFFENVFILPGKVNEKNQSLFLLLLKIIKDSRIVRAFSSSLISYKQVYVFNDYYIKNQFLCNYAKQKGATIIGVDDGSAAYCNINISRNKQMKLRTFVDKILYWKSGYIYEDISCFGTFSLISYFYALLPTYIRKELNKAKITQIDTNKYIEILKSNYSFESYKIKDSIVVFLDHSSSIEDKTFYEKMIIDLQTRYNNVFLKYHPREDVRFINHQLVRELNQNHAGEQIIFNSKNSIFIGNLSTVFLTGILINQNDNEFISISDMVKSGLQDEYLKLVLQSNSVKFPIDSDSLFSIVDSKAREWYISE